MIRFYVIKALAYIFSFLVMCISLLLSQIKKIFYFPIILVEKFKELLKNRKKNYKFKKNRVKKQRVKKQLQCNIKNPVIRNIGNRIYCIIRNIGNRIYCIIRNIGNRIYCIIRNIGNRISFIIRAGLNKSFWTLWTLNNKIYWAFYHQKNQIYKICIKNKYLELFIILCLSILNDSESVINFYPIIDYEVYHRSNKDCSYDIIEAKKQRSIYKPKFFDGPDAEKSEFESKKIYVGEVKNVKIIGGSDIVIADGQLISDVVYDDKEQRIDIAYNNIKFTLNKCAIIGEKKEVKHIEKGIYLVGAASFNYYHLLIEILSRITVVDELNKYDSYPLLVDCIVCEIPQYKRALELLNRKKHEIIYINKSEEVIVENMILPSHMVWMPINLFDRTLLRDSDFTISTRIIKNIRNSVHLVENPNLTEKIFISRKNAQTLRLKNEREIRNLFEKEGYKIVYTEEMSFDEQIECFKNAKHIIATSGAALANIVFCSKGAMIGCIIPEEHHFYMYSTIANILELNTCFLNAKIIEKTRYAAADSFVLEKEYVERYIQSFK